MKKIALSLCAIGIASILRAGIAPTYVQVPSAFESKKIITNTSRYFLQRVSVDYLGSNEKYAFSLHNTGTSIARISALGCATYATGADYFTVSSYKNGIISGTNYTPINNSTFEISKNGYFSGGLDEVYTLQGVGNNGKVRAFEYIPKEIYSVIVAPGETLTVTIKANGSTIYNILIMWEEIIS